MYVRINETRDQNGVVKINLLFSANRQLRTDVDDDAFDNGDIAMVANALVKTLKMRAFRSTRSHSDCPSAQAMRCCRAAGEKEGWCMAKNPTNGFIRCVRRESELKFGKIFCSAKASRASSMPGIV